MDDDQQFCLRWNNHQSTLISVFDTLLENGTLVDCTLAAEGKFLKAHKVVLSACSPYFAALLSQQYDKHPIFILKDVKFQELRAMMDYMYRGEVNISQDQLAALLKAAESLQIKGLSDNRSSSTAPPQQKQAQSEASASKSLLAPVLPASKVSGLTIENKRPLKPDIRETDVSGSREGSVSPTLRKRKKIRRRSVDNNNQIESTQIISKPKMDDDQQFCLRWNNHQSTLISVFDTLLENGTLVDCTLAAEGKFLKAHKVVLSACSPYFAALLSQQYDKHSIFILKDVKFQELRAMMDYMYRGEVNISQDQLAALLKAAESLQIKGLSDNRSSSTAPPQQKQAQSEASASKSLLAPVLPASKVSGLTIENKRPLKPDIRETDVSGSREGSVSPTLRKRKKIRRRSVDNNNQIGMCSPVVRV
ncbi:protein bric-a-brac 1 [Aedes albopictus]|uniref:BTB domain-containing protein n=1 Tax=Aedes albopictus TaxID=7160 RepID=A0ABM1ZYV5_AEDAL